MGRLFNIEVAEDESRFLPAINLWVDDYAAKQKIFPRNQRVKLYPLILVAAVAFTFLAVSVRVACAITFYEDFENPLGTDNGYQTFVGLGNELNPNFTSPALPSSWGKKSGEIILVPEGLGQGAFWMNLDASNSLTGYFYRGSFFVAKDGLRSCNGCPNADVGEVANIAVAKPTNWTGNAAAWRLGIQNFNNQLSLFVIFGWNSSLNNSDAAYYRVPINLGEAYTVNIIYDNLHRLYSWSLDGQLEAAAPMPSDYPLIGAEIMGSSGSATGHNTVLIIDNIVWEELPGATPPLASRLFAGVAGAAIDPPVVPEPATWAMMGLGFSALGYATYRRGGRRVGNRYQKSYS